MWQIREQLGNQGAMSVEKLLMPLLNIQLQTAVLSHGANACREPWCLCRVNVQL